MKRIILIIISFFLIIIGILCKILMKPIYSYTIQKNSDYSVTLKENEFYDSNTLPSNYNYVSKGIDFFSIKFNYDFEGTKEIDVKGNYDITANLVVFSEDDKEIFNKKFKLIDTKTIADNGKIKENININYDKYNDLVKLYEKKFDISTNSILKVKLNVNMKIENEELEDYIELDIPLNVSVTNITDNYEKNSSKEIFDNINYKEIIFISVGLIIDIIVIIDLIKNRKKKNFYEKNLRKIIREYKELIITVKRKPNLENLKILYLSNFEDLIDVAEQNKKNIIHYVVEKNKISNFYVIVDKIVYFYEIKD